MSDNNLDANASKYIQPLRIETKTINNCKIANAIHKPSVFINSVLYIKVEYGKQCIVKLPVDPNIHIENNNITFYDSIIMDTVYTLIINGYNIFPIEWIAKIMSADINSRPTQTRINQINSSLEKLSNIKIEIDCTEQAQLRAKKGSALSYTYKGYLLPIEFLTARYPNGKQCRICHVINKPALYQYAEAIKQLISLDIRYYTYCGYETDESILIRHYIIKEVAVIKSNTNRSPRISLRWEDKNGNVRGLYHELGYYPNNNNTWRKHTKPRILKIIRATLSTLVDNGYIIGYTIYRENNSNNPAVPIAGFIIQY